MSPTYRSRDRRTRDVEIDGVTASYQPDEQDVILDLCWKAEHGSSAAIEDIRLIHAIKARFDATIEPPEEDSSLSSRAAAKRASRGSQSPPDGQGTLPEGERLADPGENALGRFSRAETGAPETQREAAVLYWEQSGSDRKTVLKLIREAGDRGLICDEIERITGFPHQTASARVNELWRHERMGGWIEPALSPGGQKRRRRTSHGREAQVWVLTPRARHDTRLAAL